MQMCGIFCSYPAFELFQTLDLYCRCLLALHPCLSPESLPRRGRRWRTDRRSSSCDDSNS